MKKFLLSLIVVVGISGTYTFANDCKDVEFDNGSVCVGIEQVSSKTFKLTTDVNDGSSSLRCGILTPDKPYKDVDCNGGTFTVSKLDTQRIKIFIKQGSEVPTDWDDKPSDSSKWLFPQWDYDFDNEEWADSSYDGSDSSSSSSSNGDLDNFYLTTDDSSPSTNQRVDLTVKARDNSDDTITDYDGDIDLTVYYRSSSSSSWTKTTSSTYFEIDDDSYSFKSSDDGVHKFSDLIKFKKSYEYKVVVTDNDENVTSYKIFDVGGSSSSSSSNGDLDNFYLTTDDSSPSTNQRVDLTVKARDSDDDTVTDYDGDIDFTVYYRSSSSSSWTKTTSSTYFEIDDDSYSFTSSDDGVHKFSDLIRFKKSYEYKVVVTDDNEDISSYKIFDVGGSSSSSSSNGDLDNFYLTTDDSSPSTNQRVDLTVKARDNSDDTITDYDGDIDLTVYYRSSSSSSWTKTASSTYFEIDDDSYSFTSSDDGVHKFADLIRFKKSYEYKVVVTDNDENVTSYKIFDVGGSSSSSSSSDTTKYSLTLADSSPDAGDKVKLTVKALDSSSDTVTDYDGANATVSVEYRKSSSYSRTDLTSTYGTISDDEPDFSNGIAYTYITFKKDYEYRITVTDNDDEDISTYKTITVGSTSSSSSSSVDGYTSSQLSVVQKLYDGWDEIIDSFKNDSTKLKYNTTWLNMSDDLQDEMQKILDDDSDKLYDNYTEFKSGYNKWYDYTIAHK